MFFDEATSSQSEGESLDLYLPDYIEALITFKKVPFYNDEPKIFQYVAEFRGLLKEGEATLGYGSDLERHSAVRKAVYEAIERECLRGDKETKIIRLRSTEVPWQTVGPNHFQPFTSQQLDSQAFRRMRIHDDAEFLWTSGINALTSEETWIPAQLVFCPYNISSEPVIRFPSSNGAALGRTPSEAKCRASLEVFERDAFMCWYLAAAPASIIDLDEFWQNEEIKRLSTIYRRYRLELKVLLLHSRWSFPVVLAVIIDHTGLGPGLRVGLKCHPSLSAAIKGAISEAQQMRPWLRDHMLLHGMQETYKNSDVVDPWSRALYWARQGQFQVIDNLWKSANQRVLEFVDGYVSISEVLDWDTQWDRVLSSIQENGAELYLFDLSGHWGQEIGINVFKAVIPQAHPVYMDERFPYLKSVSLMSALDSFGPRWKVEGAEELDFTMPPHPFS